MLTYAETASSSSIVSLPPVPCSPSQEHGAEPLASWPMHTKRHWFVSAAVAEGYQAAQHTFHTMEEECENGAYVALTGYEYAHLARQYPPTGLTAVQKKDWQRGFILGWVGCVLSVYGLPVYCPLYGSL